jgi:hypothetical protein
MLCVSLVALAALTLTPRAALIGSIPAAFSCLLCSPPSLRDALLNVALFIPLGFALGFLGLSTMRAGGVALLVSLVVEALQGFVVVGRDASVFDLITNTIGGAVGAIIAAGIWTILKPSPQQACRLFAAQLALWAAICFTSAWALVPDVPEHPGVPAYWGQHAHLLAGKTRLRGRVISAEAQLSPLPDGRVPDAPALRAMILRSGHYLTASLNGMPLVDGAAQIVAVIDTTGTTLSFLQQEDCDLVYSARIRGFRVGLNAPAVRIYEACGPPNEGLVVAGWYTGQQIGVSIHRAGDTRRQEVAITAGSGWMLLLPFPHLAGKTALWRSLWFLSILVPLCYWLHRSHLSNVLTRTAAFIGLSGSTEWLASLSFGRAAPTLPEWALIGVAAAGGTLLFHISLGRAARGDPR